MRVFKPPEYGFCYGVKRTIEIAYKEAKESSVPVYTYGPLIHNPQVVNLLISKSIVPIKNLKKIPKGKLIIRSHGVSPYILQEAKELGFSIVDATCPFVKRAQKYAIQLVKEGYEVFIIGEKDHPEVQGILGHTNYKAKVIEKIEKLKIKNKKLGIIAQTTMSMKKFKKVIEKLIELSNEIRIFNTICKDVILRQQHTIELAKEVELMLVVGGKNSANTTRLVELAKEYTETYHIETEEEIKNEWVIGKKKIGIASGASTPDWIIKKVERKLKTITS
jgi:4-hydroxy-3-methylbut-2-enyl diphosphate reductase